MMVKFRRLILANAAKGGKQIIRMKVLIATAMLILGFAVQSHADLVDMVVNVPGTSNVKQYVVNPISVQLNAGTYTATPVAPPFPGAIYTAYSYYGGVWGWDFQVVNGIGSDRVMLLDTDCCGTSSDPNTAFQKAKGGSFTLATSQTVYFGVGDSYNGDNTGGVSVHLVETNIVPEPVSSILFITGGTLLAGRRFIRRKA